MDVTIRPVPTRLVTLLVLHENAHEQVCRRGGDMIASRGNLLFSRQQIADWIAAAETLYPEHS